MAHIKIKKKRKVEVVQNPPRPIIHRGFVITMLPDAGGERHVRVARILTGEHRDMPLTGSEADWSRCLAVVMEAMTLSFPSPRH